MIFLLIAIFILISLLYLINMKETFYSQDCNGNLDKGVLNSLNNVNRVLKDLNINSLELPCNI